MNVQCYLNFNGRCEEALNFYSKAVGAKVGMLMRFKEAPPQEPGATPSEGCAPPDSNKVMHSAFTVGETLLMATDGVMDKAPNFDGFSLSLTVKEPAEVDKLLGALGEGGKITMTGEETFFAKRFGMVQDKFGVDWMVIAPKPM